MGRAVLHVVSHGPYCFDGVAAAASIARFHEGADVRPTFVANGEVDRVLRGLEAEAGEQLWIADVSWNDADTDAHLRRLIERGVEVHWFDHHRTAIERLRAGGYQLSFTTRIVTDEFSAAKLVYDHLARRAAESLAGGGTGAPERFRSFARVVDMADDNDRWLHRIAGSRAMGLTLRAMPAGEPYRSLLVLGDDVVDTPAMAAARARLDEELGRNRRLAEATRVTKDLGRVKLTAALCDGYAGEIADAWGKTSPRTLFALFDVRSQALSFRRSPDLDDDLSRLAEAFGGGGHPAAAGAMLPELPPQLGEVIARWVAREIRVRA
jgi:oligoribonuclease NrnB/cAMP/cGMP phosphodiesterase (DHH superfamily)